MNRLCYVGLLVVMVGCIGASPKPLSESRARLLSEAREALASEEFYKARQLAGKALERNPQDAEAEQLMATIFSEELARHKEVQDSKAREELTAEEGSQEVKTWLERARGFLAGGRYEDALVAAEKVFLFEPGNQEASQLVDEIRKSAGREGRRGELLVRQLTEEEIQSRVDRYRAQAKAWIRSGHWGAARLAVQKILLLAPGDREAIRLYEEIQAQKKGPSA